MAQKGGLGPKTTCDFDFQDPADCLYVADGGLVSVTINATGECGDGFTATISAVQGGPSVSTPQSLVNDPVGSNRWTAQVGVGPFQDTTGAPNRFVSVTSNSGVPRGKPFRAVHPGSGSCPSGSGSDDGILTAALPGVQIPRTLYAHIAYAAVRNQAVALAYDPNTSTWNSDAVCGPGGFRLVSGVTTWELVVKGQTKYQASVAPSGPSVPFQIGFRGVALLIQGGEIANADVEILLG